MDSTVTFDILDPSGWGVEAHGANLGIAEECGPVRGTWIIDVENNPDGSFAGLGMTRNGKDIFFIKNLPVKNVFEDAALVGHNIKYDVQMLRSWGLNVSPDQICWDTQLAEYVRDSTRNRYGLKDLAYDAFGARYPTFKDLVGKGKKAVPIGSLPTRTVAAYNGCDVLFTYKLYQKQLNEFTEEQVNYLEQIELPTMRVLLEMEERGVQIDARYIRDLDSRFTVELGRVADVIRAVAQTEINLNSHRQIKQLLLDKAGLQLQSTAAEELKKHENVPLVKSILRYRELAKLRSTYTQTLLERSNGKETYRLKARFNQSITHTGRLSSSDPNLQNIPTRTEEGDAIRQGFIASNGLCLVDGDYSQIEPRLMAHFSKDEKLCEIFRTGQDLYDSVAKLVGCTRQIAKILWLAMAYNAGAYKISVTAGITRTQAEVFLTRMKLAFPQFFYWREKVIAQAELDGGVQTMFGRWIPLPRELAHLAPNYKVQGSAGEIMKLAIQSTREYQPVSTIHDELLFEVPEAMRQVSKYTIKQAMESVVQLDVPLVVEIGVGPNWSAAKDAA